MLDIIFEVNFYSMYINDYFCIRSPVFDFHGNIFLLIDCFFYDRLVNFQDRTLCWNVGQCNVFSTLKIQLLF